MRFQERFPSSKLHLPILVLVQRLNQKLRTFFPVLESISESSDSHLRIRTGQGLSNTHQATYDRIESARPLSA
jgi:hypothetical protein